jgi:membrane-bound lytic murein transglycosylase B
MSPELAAAPRAATAARTRTAIAAGLAAALLLVAQGSAGAESADEAKARADAAAQRVAVLQKQVDAAQDAYHHALDGLAGAISREVSANQNVAAAEKAALAARQQRAAAIRALDQSGGSLGVLESVLTAGSPSEFAARWNLSTDVVDTLVQESDDNAAKVAKRRAEAERRDRQATRVMVTVADVQDAYDKLDAVLSEQQDILDTLDSHARELAHAERLQARIQAEREAAANDATSSAGQATASGIPKDYLALYRAAAATCDGLPWPVLAAVGQVESGHGTNVGPSSSGAMGPMQFLPSTFAAYAVDGDKDGDTDIWSPADSIYTAAHYLCANGGGNGPRGLYTALWHYNQADWYVQLVIRVAGEIATRFGETVPTATA